MPKTKEISVDLRNEIVEAHKGGKGYRVIGNMFHIPTSTVGYIIRKWKEYQTTENLPRTGATKKISTRALNRITRIVSKIPQTTRKELVEKLEAVGTLVSKHTVFNALRECGLHPSKARKSLFCLDGAIRWCEIREAPRAGEQVLRCVRGGVTIRAGCWWSPAYTVEVGLQSAAISRS